MIYAITSKKGGCGRTTVALLTSILTASKVSGSTVLADLSYGNDVYSLLKAHKPNASIDNLISAVGLDPHFVSFEENLVDVQGLFFLPGTQVNQTRYLEKRYTNVKDLLELLHVKFNSVIIDVDYALYEDLVDLGLPITPIHVLEQNILNIQKYQEEMKLGVYDGFYVVNKYNKNVYPDLSFFDRNFKKGSLIVLDNDTELMSSVNRKKIDFSAIKTSGCYEGLSYLSDLIAKDITVTTSNYTSRTSALKKGVLNSIFNGLFGTSTQGSKSKKTSKSKSKTSKGKKPSKQNKQPVNAVNKKVVVGGEE